MASLKLGLIAAVSLLFAAHAAVPDIYGPWIIASPHGKLTPLDGGEPPLLPGKNRGTGADPSQSCLPPGVPRLMLQNYPFSIVQGQTMYAMLFEWNHLNRIIHFIPAHTDTIGPMYAGQSIGHWEGDTLVVDTNSYNDTTWLDDSGLPHSDQLHTIERLTLLDGGAKLADVVTIDDPATYAKTWQTKLVFKKTPGTIITEDYCLGRLNKDKLKVD